MSSTTSAGGLIRVVVTDSENPQRPLGLRDRRLGPGGEPNA
jgi:hypothetical protein